MFRSQPAEDERRRRFEALAFPQMNALYNLALRLMRHRFDAEDLVQETCLRAFRSFDQFAAGSNFKAWIFRILTNVFINEYRRKKRVPPQVDFEKNLHSVPSVDDEGPDPFATARDEQRYADLFGDEVSAALQKLSPEFRMVVLLCDLEEFSYKEIAGILGVPIGTVMSRLSRARRQLQQHLGEYARRTGAIKPQKPLQE
ncbi:MAG: sigma-70 family RNA polymerase sigma factor [candidate division KSB1 bacterium]|nr:sigma-70 family RNA polymerase sigma factor [candidate division KSB1 bacterium]MDZ7276518.1 sigma-70 family RNA polymerase sigma factor [candidate division KSB1 bacterium]MDZ7286701.1 sigma-70 family RNA polymerase sigma factor [candidate division KSB1 bacterium]MDZ7300288.1 sigma-70 family RNA polymerase sigma factor [candidate division KSB1 bacterium]MDZ7307889.1 sigma-70 family RNA polymerase sigma factor [candidate division KSB1 bacterium]